MATDQMGVGMQGRRVSENHHCGNPRPLGSDHRPEQALSSARILSLRLGPEV